MKAKKNPGVKKVVQEAPSSKLAEELAQKEQILLNLTQELHSCQKIKQDLQLQLTQYKQQPVQTLYNFYRDAGLQYYNHSLVIPLNHCYEDINSKVRKFIADAQNQLQTKIHSAQQWIAQLQQQFLDYIQLAQQLYQHYLNTLFQQKNQLLHNSQQLLLQLQTRVSDFIRQLSEKLPFSLPKPAFTNAEVATAA